MNPDEHDEMFPEYDFSNQSGQRGRYYQAYRQGHRVNIQKGDGSIETRYFTLEEGAIMLEPDVSAYFPDSESVNGALRGLIAFIPNSTHQSGR